jgi:hypothetical protein
MNVPFSQQDGTLQHQLWSFGSVPGISFFIVKVPRADPDARMVSDEIIL